MTSPLSPAEFPLELRQQVAALDDMRQDSERNARRQWVMGVVGLGFCWFGLVTLNNVDHPPLWTAGSATVLIVGGGWVGLKSIYEGLKADTQTAGYSDGLQQRAEQLGVSVNAMLAVARQAYERVPSGPGLGTVAVYPGYEGVYAQPLVDNSSTQLRDGFMNRSPSP